jgi:hypothetical protein
MTTQIKLRRDLSIAWTDANPILALGEPGLETDTVKLKYGDGTTHWNDLPYANGLPEGMISGSWDDEPTLFNDNANGYHRIQTQAGSYFYDDNQYSRNTLSWHDMGDYSNYSHVMADPYGVSIRNADWTGNRTNSLYYWLFGFDGITRFPNGLLFDWWDDGNISNDYVGLYQSDPTGEKGGGDNNNYRVQLQSMTDWVEGSDYGRSTLSWHDYNYSVYSHVHCDPYGVSIRNAAWEPGGYTNYWAFNNNGTTNFPGDINLQNDTTISNPSSGVLEVNGSVVDTLVTSAFNQTSPSITREELTVAVNSSGRLNLVNNTGSPYQVQYAGTFIDASSGTTTGIASNQANVLSASGGSYQPGAQFINIGDTLNLTVHIPDLSKIFRITVVGGYNSGVPTGATGYANIIIERLM